MMERPVKIDGTYRNTAEGQTVPARTRALTRSDEVAIAIRNTVEGNFFSS